VSTRNRNALKDLIAEKALRFGDFVLASGARAKFYLDCRKVTLDPVGANLIANELLDLFHEDHPNAVGGMAIGADPITAAIVVVAGQRNLPIRGFMVRKEAKQHGTGQVIEGPVRPGDRVIIVEDVITSGDSALRAVAACRDFGLVVLGACGLIDRLAGGSQRFAASGCPLRTLFTIRDFGIED
jgi:orotate phosphoribosyltransferase